MMSQKHATLRDRMNYQPEALRFGTSGRRGQVMHLTQLEICINAVAELEYLLSLPRAQGGLVKGEPFYFASDLRPSSTCYVPAQGGRGEIAQAIEQAILYAGLHPVYLGQIPTPALTYHALRQGKGSIMVTGSHIPFDRNGYKTNSAIGELLKTDEAPIQEHVDRVRARFYAQPFAQSLFTEAGLFKTGHRELSAPDSAGRTGYARRFVDFFDSLSGLRLLVYQHSAVGRDLLVEILEQLGAEVITAGRSETFVPIDTENIGQDLVDSIQSLLLSVQQPTRPIDAVVSTDGDSDRPLILGVDRSAKQVRFFGGDLVGMVAAEFLGPDAVVVPISCNDAVDGGYLKSIVEPKTRIGSPYVIAGMQRAAAHGKRRICGWEANGGFLTGSDWELDGKQLDALPTRDAVLPILAVLAASVRQGLPLTDLFARLPPRFSTAALLKDVPRQHSLDLVARLAPSNPEINDIILSESALVLRDVQGRPLPGSEKQGTEAKRIWAQLQDAFKPEAGFDSITRVNYTDGVRIYFVNGDVAHVRPSGNADELRIYAVADRPERAAEIARLGVAEPAGLLRSLLEPKP